MRTGTNSLLVFLIIVLRFKYYNNSKLYLLQVKSCKIQSRSDLQASLEAVKKCSRLHFFGKLLILKRRYVLRGRLLSCFDAWFDASCCCAAVCEYKHLAFSLCNKADLLDLQQSAYLGYARLSRGGHTPTNV